MPEHSHNVALLIDADNAQPSAIDPVLTVLAMAYRTSDHVARLARTPAAAPGGRAPAGRG